MHCLVLLNSRSIAIGDGLTYESGVLQIEAGMLVTVPLRNKKMEGIVLSVSAAKDATFTPKPIIDIISATPLLSKNQLQTAAWIAMQYHCTLASAVRPFLPASPWRHAIPKTSTYLRVQSPLLKGGAKQLAIMHYLETHTYASIEEVRLATGASGTTIQSLIDKGCISTQTELSSLHRVSSYPLTEALPTLTDPQVEALRAIQKSSVPSLLYGVTGSGKTEIYAHLIAEQAAKGKQSILLLPEILLTQQLITRFEKLFSANHLAILHSRLTPAAKRKEWMRIHRGEVALVIGSRSALFAPCQELGLIIIDEEHEWTYKNEQTPRYHARETAQYMSTLFGARLVLGSATPSLESWHRAEQKRYTRVELSQRYQNQPMPTVQVIDLATVDFGTLYPFSPPLLGAIENRLQKGEQSVLFLNRRGVATSVLCLECRKRLTSPASQLPFTLHRTGGGKPYLQDHIGGITVELPATCPYCGSTRLHPVGAGTQKVEDIVTHVFPHARVLRADSDTLKHPEQMKEVLQKMQNKEADILLGTQSVVKGLDIPGVTLAAVLLADTGLSLPHFRAGERVFQLLTQLTGRSGRKLPGEVIIQTYRPDSPEVHAAATHAATAYLDAELELRKKLFYPPSTEMIRFLFQQDKPEIRAHALQKKFSDIIKQKNMRAWALAAPTLFGGGNVWHVLLRGEGTRVLLSAIDTTGMTVDIDPVDVL